MREEFNIELESLRRGDSASWNAAYPILWQRVLSAIYAVLGHLGSHDLDNLAAEIIAEEVMPQVFAPTTNSFNQIRSFDDLLNVTRTIAKNRTIDFLRKRLRRPEEVVAEIPEPFFLGPVGDPAPVELLHLVLGHLEPPDPDLFRDRFEFGLTTREIALKRGLSHGTVVSRFSRAFVKLRCLLGKELAT